MLRNSCIALIAAVALTLSVSQASAEVYQNDGFEDNTAVGFQGGFVLDEQAAVCFSPPEEDFPLQLTAIRLIYGGGALGSTLAANFRVFGAGGNGSPPADMIHMFEDIELTSANDAMSELDITPAGITVNSSFCVSIESQHAGLPSIARDNDGTIDAGNNWIYAIDPISMEPLGWIQSALFGLEGDWIIRVVGEPGSGGGTRDTGAGGRDTGTVGDTGRDTGGGGDTGVGDDVRGGDTAGGAVRIDSVDQDGEDPSEDITITIEGSGFQDSFSYRVSARSLDDIDVNGAGTRVEGILEAGDLGPGTYDVIVRGDFGEETFSAGVILVDTELPAPSIIAVTPDQVDFGESTQITVIGDNFDESARVILNNRPLPSTTFVNAQTLTNFVPNTHVDEAGEYELIVETDGGRSLPYPFEFEEVQSGGQSGGCSAARGAWAGWGLLALAALLRRRR